MARDTRKELVEYCALLLKEYEFQFSPDDPVIPALYVIHKEMELNSLKNEVLRLQVKETASKINPVVFHFNASGEALKFQLGIALKWVIASALILGFLWSGFLFYSAKSDLEKAKNIIRTHSYMGEFFNHVRQDKDRNFFIDFTLSKRDSIRDFIEYKRIDAKTIRVSLGKGYEGANH